METILITGGTGLVGTQLAVFLKEAGYQVLILGRSKSGNTEFPTYKWDYKSGHIDIEAIEKADFIIHLAGANIGDKRWTDNQKKIIIDSRVKTTELLFKAVQEHNHKLKAFVSASAIGFYGALTSEHIFVETDDPCNDFLGKVCKDWEEANANFEQLNIRTINLRIGVVLTKDGGPLSKLVRPIKFGLGSVLGSGKQYMSWIHIHDLCNMFLKVIQDNNLQGIFNAVAPSHITNEELTRTISHILRRHVWLPKIPETILKLIFGEMACTFLKGSRVSADKILKTGFTFKYPEPEIALKNLIAPKS